MSQRMAPARGVLAVAIALASLVVGCATDRPPAPGAAAEARDPEAERLLGLALDRWIERTERLQRISQRLRVAGSELCESKRASVLGAAILDLSHVPPALRNVSRERFGAETGLFVLAVFPDMAAARAGLRPGDRIAKVDGRHADDLSDLGRTSSTASPLDLELTRSGGALGIGIEPDLGCESSAELVLSETVNAYAGRDRLVVTTSLMREVRDDASFALIIGHEIAHQILDLKRQSAPNTRRESRADYLGIYLAAMAGFPPPESPDLYLVLSRDVNSLAKRTASHPTSPSRSLAFRKTLEEIEDRKRNGLPLRPDS